MQLRWRSNQQPQIETSEETVKGSPLIAYILTQKKLGTSRKVIYENLMKQGFPYRNIKNAFSLIDKLNSPKLDWRSPTAINETARMIRRDVRSGRVSYVIGMRLLIQARDNLKTLIVKPGDRRIQQINQEIKTTKKLLMPKFANPYMVQQYRVIGAQA